MSEFNGLFWITSPEAEEKYNDNKEYAKESWLEIKSAEQDRGLFALYYGAKSGTLGIIPSEMLKKEKPFLTENFYTLISSKEDKEKEFKSLLDKHMPEVINKPSEDETAASAELISKEDYQGAIEEMNSFFDEKMSSMEKAALAQHEKHSEDHNALLKSQQLAHEELLAKLKKSHSDSLVVQTLRNNELTAQIDLLLTTVRDQSEELKGSLKAIQEKSSSMAALGENLEKSLIDSKSTLDGLQNRVRVHDEQMAEDNAAENSMSPDEIKQLISDTVESKMEGQQKVLPDDSMSSSVDSESVIASDEDLKIKLKEILEEINASNPDTPDGEFVTMSDFEQLRKEIESGLPS